ncbi:uncharacterized protein BDZ99DRAFT_539936 [Mytilinidion resinicola]|uniref:Uncharacterized protein n=1 Tax=Mytilinidion resinicola TaxID=574789 RepID=A0A6A6YA60_9PEZI|nr:uncharacterized protein BDZ99DRAFT_539936 [Mytilinidion resinicola]KAF2805509.1 hypothetical protein BDZ99DRAFT_539936 [Mytilinidion resinicola]
MSSHASITTQEALDAPTTSPAYTLSRTDSFFSNSQHPGSPPTREAAESLIREAKNVAELVTMSNATSTIDKTLFMDLFDNNRTPRAQAAPIATKMAVFAEAQLLTSINSAMEVPGGLSYALDEALGRGEKYRRWPIFSKIQLLDRYQADPDDRRAWSKHGLYAQRCHNAHVLGYTREAMRQAEETPRGERQWEIMRNVYPRILAACEDVAQTVGAMLPDLLPKSATLSEQEAGNEAPLVLENEEQEAEEALVAEEEAWKDDCFENEKGHWVTQTVKEEAIWAVDEAQEEVKEVAGEEEGVWNDLPYEDAKGKWITQPAQVSTEVATIRVPSLKRIRRQWACRVQNTTKCRPRWVY